jgi:hypothetical protein
MLSPFFVSHNDYITSQPQNYCGNDNAPSGLVGSVGNSGAQIIQAASSFS